MRVERLELAEWGDVLPETGTEVFHDPAALGVLDAHAGGDLVLLGGFRGDQPVALLPVFVSEYPVGRTVLSPPPGFGVPRLGPVLRPASPKQRKREKLNREFTDAALDELGVDSSRVFLRMVCNAAYDDPRPYTWAGLDVEPTFTYRLDVAGRDRDDLLGSFSKSLRREIRQAEDVDVTIRVEGVEGARAVYTDTARRYEEQGRAFPMTWEYVRDLVDALDDRCRVYVARDHEGGFLGGITVLYSNDTAYFWQGGAVTTHENVALNGALHWRIIEDVVDGRPRQSVRSYDLVGANTARICQYKSKFGATLVPTYVVESSGVPMDVAKKAFRLVKR